MTYSNCKLTGVGYVRGTLGSSLDRDCFVSRENNSVYGIFNGRYNERVAQIANQIIPSRILHQPISNDASESKLKTIFEQAFKYFDYCNKDSEDKLRENRSKVEVVNKSQLHQYDLTINASCTSSITLLIGDRLIASAQGRTKILFIKKLDAFDEFEIITLLDSSRMQATKELQFSSIIDIGNMSGYLLMASANLCLLLEQMSQTFTEKKDVDVLLIKFIKTAVAEGKSVKSTADYVASQIAKCHKKLVQNNLIPGTDFSDHLVLLLRVFLKKDNCDNCSNEFDGEVMDVGSSSDEDFIRDGESEGKIGPYVDFKPYNEYFKTLSEAGKIQFLREVSVDSPQHDGMLVIHEESQRTSL